MLSKFSLRVIPSRPCSWSHLNFFLFVYFSLTIIFIHMFWNFSLQNHFVLEVLCFVFKFSSFPLYLCAPPAYLTGFVYFSVFPYILASWSPWRATLQCKGKYKGKKNLSNIACLFGLNLWEKNPLGFRVWIYNTWLSGNMYIEKSTLKLIVRNHNTLGSLEEINLKHSGGI